MRRRTGILMLCLVSCGAGEIIDRLAVTVGKEAITDSAIRLEIRLAAFLNGEAPDFGPEARRAAAQRLVDRVLLKGEMALSQYSAPEPSAAAELLTQIKRERFPNELDYRRALEKFRISEEELNRHLFDQIATLRFIEIRFRPAVHILETEMRDYYEKRVLGEWHNDSRKPAPSFEEVREKIERILTEERVDLLVDDWLRETRSRTRIELVEKAFK